MKKDCKHPLWAVYSVGSGAGPEKRDNHLDFKCGICSSFIRRFDDGTVEINGKPLTLE